MRNLLSTRLRILNQQFLSAHYRDAARTALEAYQAAESFHQHDLALKFLANLGSCRIALRQYREALDALTEARRLAQASGNALVAAVADSNMASAYEQMGELDAAADYAWRGISCLSGTARQQHGPKMLIQLASLRARQDRREDAARLFATAIAEADDAGDIETCALGWDRLGEEAYRRGDLAGAERLLLEAWRLRKLNRLPALDISYWNVGRLRLAQGDLQSAETLLDQAVARVRTWQRPMPTWDVYHARGQLRLEQGRTEAALEDLRVAVRLARAWRAGVSPADATRASSEQKVELVHASLARAAATAWFQTRRPQMLRESFEAVEENRALSLRALLESGVERRRQLPEEYWETLEQLQGAEAALLRKPDDHVLEPQAARLRTELAGMENRLNPVLGAPPSGSLGPLQQALGPDAVYFGFLLGPAESYLWCVDRAGAALVRLPGRATLATAASRFAAAVREARPEADERGSRLYAMLFGGAPRRFTARPRWLLALDDDLFAVPMAALREGHAYLAERHSLQLVSAASLVALAGRPGWRQRLAGAFLGVGDPVYNLADNRWQRTRRPYFGLLEASGSAVQLPRLVGSSGEIAQCAAEWSGRTAILLEGDRARKAKLRPALAAGASVAHLATHVLLAAGPSQHGLIALSLGPNEEPEILSSREIASWDAPAGLVTLSGCGSGSGPALPGTGLMGLTRAWLAAGAGAVAATRWATPDGTGLLLRSLYRFLREDPDAGPAAALARAQREMLQLEGWRSRPQYWGAYFMVSNQ